MFSDLMIQSQYFGVPAPLGLHKCLSNDTHYSPPVLRGWSGRNTLPPTGMRLFFPWRVGQCYVNPCVC